MKKILKIPLYLLLVLFFFNNCRTKKTVTEYKDKIVHDTIIKNVTKTVTKQIKDTILIEEPCDSIGNLKDFSRVIKNDKAKVEVSNSKGNIEVKINIDSLVNSKVEEFKKNYKSEVIIKKKEIVKFRTPWYMYVIIGFSILLNIVLIRLN